MPATTGTPSATSKVCHMPATAGTPSATSKVCHMPATTGTPSATSKVCHMPATAGTPSATSKVCHMPATAGTPSATSKVCHMPATAETPSATSKVCHMPATTGTPSATSKVCHMPATAETPSATSKVCHMPATTGTPSATSKVCHMPATTGTPSATSKVCHMPATAGTPSATSKVCHMPATAETPSATSKVCHMPGKVRARPTESTLMNKKKLKKHIDRKHAHESVQDINARFHLASQCVDKPNGIFAVLNVARDLLATAYPQLKQSLTESVPLSVETSIDSPQTKKLISVFELNVSYYSRSEESPPLKAHAHSEESTEYHPLYPPHDLGLKQMVQYILQQGKEYPKYLCPEETICQRCPGVVPLSEPILITKRAKILSNWCITKGGRRNPCAVSPTYHFWAPWIGKHTRHSDTVLNTEFEKIHVPKSVSEISEITVTEDRLREELYKQKVGVIRKLCKERGLDSNGSRNDHLLRLSNEMKSRQTYDKRMRKSGGPLEAGQ
ncbi:hypothetical protein QQF64_006894 [Cirrhinus molitorella]|uniref:SAP domain-containing protein n=1 Tax=Cirrhinus molitorella TaxID=172907 RepID=A0ABR3MCC7_9TELE